MSRISLICVWTRRELLDDMLLASIDAQRRDIELILVDNRQGDYQSCAAALNAGAQRATGQYFVFIHQDISFASPDELPRAVEMVARLPNCGIAGPAGAILRFRGRGQGSQMVGQIRQGPAPGELTHVQAVIQPTRVATLDELLLIVPRSVFEQVQFDPVACPGWHLYGVEFCLSVFKRNLRPYVIPMNLRHLSGGKLNEDYYRTLGRVCRKHRGSFLISTTCGNWLTILPPRWQGNTKRFLADLRR